MATATNAAVEHHKKVDFLLGIGLLAGFFFAGSALHSIGIPIPGGVLGLLLFYLALSTGLVKQEWVARASSVLLRHMVLLFVPLTVGLMDMGQVLSRQWLAIVASLVVSLLAVLLTTGLLGRWLLPAETVIESAAGPILPVLEADTREPAQDVSQ